MPTVELGLALFVAVAAIGALAKWVTVPLPILLVAGGAAISYAPGFAHVALDPHVFFLLFIPPLLFSDGWLFPKREFFALLRPILLLAFGLVAATVVAVGFLIHSLIPSLPLAAAFALGAIVSPTDAVATAAVTERLPLPPRVMHIVNGESLINDASGLVAFKFAVAAVTSGAFSWIALPGEVVLLAGGGALVGLAIAAIIGRGRVALSAFCVDDPKIQTIISLLTPYAAYLAADVLQVSGVLAAVVAGLYAGVHDSRHISLATRRHAWEVWAMALYLLNGIAFLLLGLQLKPVLLAMPRESWQSLAGYALALYAIVTVVRLAWVYPGTWLPRILFRRIAKREHRPDPRAVFLVGWAGIRGSVTLAAALSIPLSVAGGAAFPGRDLIIFLAGTTIVATLCINGLTLPLILRLLDLPQDGAAEREERLARQAMASAAADAMRSAVDAAKTPDDAARAQRLLRTFERQMQRHSADGAQRKELESVDAAEFELRRRALTVERARLRGLRETGVINDTTLRTIEAGIDHAESLLAGDSGRTR